MKDHLILSFLFIVGCTSCVAQATNDCGELSLASKQRIAGYIQKKYLLADTIRIDAEVDQALPSCYRTVRLRWATQGTVFAKQFFVSPDGSHLSSDLFDVHNDPRDDERRQQEADAVDLLQGQVSSTGPREALLTIVVFSDFQCPYCARAAELLAREMETTGGKDIRLVFRNFPLNGHRWARQAAEAGSCFASAGDREFWNIHDFFFANQPKLSAETIEEQIMGYIRTRPELDHASIEHCIQARTTKPIVDHDIELGQVHNVSATPTLFFNGHKIPPIAGQSDLHAAVIDALTKARENSKTSKESFESAK